MTRWSPRARQKAAKASRRAASRSPRSAWPRHAVRHGARLHAGVHEGHEPRIARHGRQCRACNGSPIRLSLEEQARQAAVQQLARAMLKKSARRTGAAMKNVAPPAGTVSPMADRGGASACARARRRSRVECRDDGANMRPPDWPMRRPRTSRRRRRAQARGSATIPTPPATEQTASARSGGHGAPRRQGGGSDPQWRHRQRPPRARFEHAVRAGDATRCTRSRDLRSARAREAASARHAGRTRNRPQLYQRALDKGVEEARSRM